MANESLKPFAGELDTTQSIKAKGLQPFKGVLDGDEEKRSTGEAFKDVGLGLAQGAAGLVKSAGDAYGLVTGDMDNTVSKTAGGWQESLDKEKSAGFQARAARRKENIDAQDSTLGKAWTAVKDTVTDPALALDTVATNVSTLIPGALAGRAVAAARMAQAARVGLTGEAAAAAATQAGKAGTAAALGTGAAQQATDVSAQAYEDNTKKDEAIWDANPEFQAALAANGGDRAKAKHDLSLDAARAAFLPAAGISLAANAVPGGAMLEKALVGGAAREVAKEGAKLAVPKAIAKTALGEATGEAIEEGGGQYAANVAAQQYIDPNQDLMNGVGENAGLGAAGGLLMGAAGGAFHGHRPAPGSQQEQQNALDAANQAAADALEGSPSALEAQQWSTAPGAAPDGAPDQTQAASPLYDPRIDGMSTSPGAAQAQGNEVEFTRDFDTAGLALAPDAPAGAPAAPGPDAAADLAQVLDQRTPAQRMGLDENAGTMSAAAVLAVNSGAAGQLQAASAAAAAQQQDAKAQEPAAKTTSAAPASAVDADGHSFDDARMPELAPEEFTARQRKLNQELSVAMNNNDRPALSRIGDAKRELFNGSRSTADLMADYNAAEGSREATAKHEQRGIRDELGKRGLVVERQVQNDSGEVRFTAKPITQNTQQAPEPGVYATYEDARKARGEQNARGTSVKVIPSPVEGGFILAAKGTPEYVVGEKYAEQRRKQDSAANRQKMAESNAKYKAAADLAKQLKAEREGAQSAQAAAASTINRVQTTGETANGIEADQAQQAGPQRIAPTGDGGSIATENAGPGARAPRIVAKGRAAAGPVDGAGSGQPAQGLTDGSTTTANPGAKASPAPSPQAQAQEPAQQRAQQLDDAGAAWARMPAAERQGVAARLDGVKPVIAKNLPKSQWKNLNGDLQRKIADAIAPAPVSSNAPMQAPEPAGAPAGPVQPDAQASAASEPAPTAESAAVASAAHEAATSQQNDLPAPTEAQLDAGNYRKGHVRINGLDISIENPAGSKRRPEWPALKNHYGYLKGTVGADKDHVDVFLTDRASDSSLPVFVVDQVNRDGTFDEHKVVLGAANEADARQAYLDNYAKGWTGLGAITEMTQDEFKAWARDPSKTKVPAGKPGGRSADSNSEQNASKITSEFPLKEAASSYSGISHSGTSRAKADAAEFDAYLDKARKEGEAVARSEAQKAAVDAAVDALRADYLAQYRRLMGVRADTYSGFVAGRSGLNSKQADKRNSAYDRAIDTFVGWQKANQDRARQSALDARTEAEKTADRQAAKQALADKAKRKEDGNLGLMRKILSWNKDGDPVAVSKTANLAGVNLGRDGYPSSIKLVPTDGTTLTDNKFDLAALFRTKGMTVPDSKKRVRDLVDAVRAEDANTPEVDSSTKLDQTSTAAFKRWFGDSKVVDADGKPLVMYHGTSGSQNGEAFTSFDVYASNYGLMGMGGYFTADPAVASSYTAKGKGDTPSVYPVYLSIKKPLDMDAPADVAAWKKQFPDAESYHESGTSNESWYRAAEESVQEKGLPRWEGAEVMQDSLRAMGFDGITHIGGGRVKTDGVQHRVFIAFEPEQIKSATGNSGAFDAADPNITAFGTREARAGTPTDRALMDMVREGKPAQDLLQLISGTSKSRFNKQVARLLMKAKVSPTVALEAGALGGDGNFTFLARYRRSTDTIGLTAGAQAQAEQILLHEMIHAATLKALDRKGVASVQMRKLYEHVKKQGGANGTYGMKNVGEFVAEAFTNPEFQRQLKQMSAPQGNVLKSAWDSLVRILHTILGLPVDSTNALSQALTLGVEVMRENVALRRRQEGSVAAKKPEVRYRTENTGQSNQAEGKPFTVAQAEAIVQGLRKGAPFLKGVQVVADPSQVPEIARDWDPSIQAIPKGATLSTGEVYIFAGGHSSKLDLIQTVFHELFHSGVLRLGDGNVHYNTMVQMAKSDPRVEHGARAWRETEVGRAQMDAIREANPGRSDNWVKQLHYAVSVEESLAEISEDLTRNRMVGTKRTVLVRRLSAALSRIADSLGFHGLAAHIRSLNLTQTERFVLNTISMASPGNTTPFNGPANGPAVRYRATATVKNDGLGAAATAIKDGAMAYVHDAMNQAPGTVHWWHKTVGTMNNLAERNPAFKPVFEAAQQFTDDVSSLANDVANQAPRLIPRLESLGDLKFWGKDARKPISGEDNTAIAKPLFEGTLMWTRDIHGKPITVDALEKETDTWDTSTKEHYLIATKELTAPQARAWQGLPLAQYEKLVTDAFKNKVLKPGIRWTDAELRSMFKLSDGQLSLFKEARSTIDASIDTTARADMMRMIGEEYRDMREAVMEAPTLDDALTLVTRTLQDEAKANPDSSERLMALHNSVVAGATKARDLIAKGYAPLSRFGSHTVDVLDAKGERLYFGLFETAREADAMQANMAEVYKGEPGVQIGRGTLSKEEYKLFAGVTPESLEAFGTMLGLDTEGNEAKDAAFQEYIRRTKNNHSALKRLIHRKGIAGYSQDVGRVLASFVYSNARQGAGALNAGIMEKAIQEIPKQQGQLRDVAMGLRSYIQDPQEEGQAVRGFLFAQYLGGSVASAVVNMLQPVQITFPWLSQYGGVKQAGAQLTRAFKDMATVGKTYEPDLAKALKRAEDEGTVSPQEIHQLMAQARGEASLRAGDGTALGNARATASNAWRRTVVAWGQPFAWAEQLNRRSTFIAAYRIAVAEKMADPDAFAAKAVKETQFQYSKSNKMRWGRGAIGGTLMTFKSYSVSYLELMGRMWNAGTPGSQQRAESRKALVLMVAMLALMGGAGGLPFVEDVEDLVNGLMNKMGYNWDSKQARKQFLQQVIGQAGAEFINSGISGLPGMPIDVAGRLGMGNLIPGTGLVGPQTDKSRDLLELVGPAGDFAKRIFNAAGMALGGSVGSAALEASPGAVRNAVKGVDMATSGMYKDGRGYKVIDTNLGEALSKFIGFQPRAVADVQEANGAMQKSRAFYTQQSADIKAQWADALFRKDEAALESVRERLASWNRKNPDMPIVVQMPQIWKKVREMGKDKQQRIADTAPKALRQQMREMAREAGGAPV